MTKRPKQVLKLLNKKLGGKEMKFKLKLRKIGDSKGVIIPAFILKQLNKKAGDNITIEIKEW